MNKYLIFSHQSDIDGINCVILAKLAFLNVDYELCPNFDSLSSIFKYYLDNDLFKQYDKIYITDLALQEPLLSIVANSNLKNKLWIFDHHQASINNNLNKYDFSIIVEENENGKTCATQLFYKYLIKNSFLNENNLLKEFVELTRLEDTWEWKKKKMKGLKAHNLAILFNAYGVDEYIFSIFNKLLKSRQKFYFTDKELYIIKDKQEEYQNILATYFNDILYLYDEFNYKFGILYANYEYRNEIADYIKKEKNPNNIKYIVIVAMDKGFGQKSYRSIDNNFDVNKLTEIYGGGGHKNASSVNITKEQSEKAKTMTKEDSLKYLAKCKFIS